MVCFLRRSSPTFRLTSDRLRGNMALSSELKTVRHRRIQQINPKIKPFEEKRVYKPFRRREKKTQRTKRLFTHLPQKSLIQFAQHTDVFSSVSPNVRSSGQRRRDPAHVYFICAFFTKRHPAGNGRRNRIRNIWHRIGVADVLLCSS